MLSGAQPDTERVLLWVSDGLFGYSEPLEATLLKANDERNDANTRAEAAEARATTAEQEACEALAGAHAEQEVSRHWKEEAEYQKARVLELEAENGRFAGMLEDSVSGWRKLYTEERAERVRIEGILLNDVQAERQESDEHIKGLNAVIKTQDKAIRDLKSRVEKLERVRLAAKQFMSADEDNCHDEFAALCATLAATEEK